MTSQAQPVFVRMTINNIDDNQVFFSNEEESTQPIEVTPGQNNIFPKVEALLPSMTIGEEKSVTLSKDEAFGDIVKEAVQEVPLNDLPEDLRKEGTIVSAQTKDAQTIQGTVVSIKEEAVIIDFNHPLAGKQIEVKFTLVKNPNQ